MANIRRLFSIRKRSKESYQEGENKTDVAARQPTPTSAANFDASKLNGPTRSTKKTNISSARPSRSSSKQVARKSSNQDSPGPMEKPVVPKRAAQHRVPNGQARYDRKMRRRQMKKYLPSCHDLAVQLCSFS